MTYRTNYRKGPKVSDKYTYLPEKPDLDTMSDKKFEKLCKEALDTIPDPLAGVSVQVILKRKAYWL